MQSTAVRLGGAEDPLGPGYKWIALSNTTLGVLIATINLSIILIALPDIFRGIGADPLQPGNTSLLLWLIMSYMVVTAVLVVSFGRLGDMYGRVRMYNLAFAVFTLFSVLLSVTWMHGTAGALWLIGMRVLQGVGGGVITAIVGGLAVLGLFCLIETRVAQPMFHLALLRIRAFTAGNVASLLASLGRGGLMFILIIWLQGIWLPRHGYGFEQTPLWAGIYMLPLTIGFLIAGPFSGWASDRYGARLFTTGGMLLAAATFVALKALPVDFDYWLFALILLVNGLAMRLFASPNRAAIINSLPPDQRGVGAGISTTFQNSATVLSIGIFFSLMIAGLASTLPDTLAHGLTEQSVPSADAARVAALPPVGVLFAALLGYNPVRSLLGPEALAQLPTSHADYLTGRAFFPTLISGPFEQGLSVAFDFAIAACLVAAVVSLLRGGRYVHGETETAKA
ncbi:MFS transporter [Streptomyces sp. ITFR-6]|uniref:MFS transporter n=1 Tax=Streptomyces sp. ITFR-6 TaxID=3075197 RepID=UPI00288A0A24|nr:MFS transporter [Streptomyces sp. ITFR-6]WNI27839.1 MFS transporter [Streptomyces sp. ITFR-6]